MKQLILTLIFCIGWNVLVFSQDKEKAMLENANTVILSSEKVLTIKSASSASFHVKESRLILNNKSNWNKEAMYYNKFRKITNISGSIANSDGKVIRRLNKSDIEDYAAVSSFSIYEDSRTKYVEVQHHTYPFIFNIEYTVNYSGIRDYPDWDLQSRLNTSVYQADFIVEIPTEMKLRYKTVNTDIEPQITTEKNTTIYKWQISDLPAVTAESYSSSIYNYLPNVHLGPVNFEIAGYKGNMSTWESYGTFIYELNKRRGSLSTELKNKIKELTANLPTKREKIEVLYRYLQENTRYVSVQLGIGGWQTFPLNYVEENKYGDCKALSYFMQALLEEAGITAYQALIYSNDKAATYFDDYTDPKFNHVILYEPEDEIWLECTSNNAPVNHIGNSNENRKALIIKPAGSQLINTPSPTAKENSQVQTIKVNLEPSGKASINIDRQSTGFQQRTLRYLTEESKENQEKWLYNQLDLKELVINDYSITTQKKIPQSALTIEGSCKSGTPSGERLFFRPNVMNRSISTPKKIEDRQFPVYRQNSFLDKDIVTFTLPEGYSIEAQPKNVELETDFGKFSMAITVNGNILEYKRVFESNAFHLPAERYDDLRAFYKAISKSDNGKVVLVKGEE